MTETTAIPTGKRKRGRETAGDMLRSMSLVLGLVVMVWFFARPPASDSREVRPVDPTGDISAFRSDEPSVAAPGVIPGSWVPTVSTLAADPRSLRIGYVTPDDRYLEYAATTAPRADAVSELTGDARPLSPVDVDGVAWEQFREADGSLSLVRAYGPVTVVLGTRRATAPLAELQALARSLTVT
ncbi:MAG: DUF4245 domain-containing protein [Frankiales bacterium]|nr:DUF4245 domain-containing protein [Frankiales bacterium]